MTTIRAMQGNWSFSQSVRSYFSCCLGNSGSKDGNSKAEIITRDESLESDDAEAKEVLGNGTVDRKSSYGSVKSSQSIKSRHSVRSRGPGDGAEDVDQVSGEHLGRVNEELGQDEETPGQYLVDSDLRENQDGGISEERIGIVHDVPPKERKGSAYGGDSSSDSDDEVLRRYQQSIQRVPSQRSIHSARSHKSSASKPGGTVSSSGHESSLLMPEEGMRQHGIVNPSLDSDVHHDNIDVSVRQYDDATSSHSAAWSSQSTVRSHHRTPPASSRAGTSVGERVSPAVSQSQVVYENSAFDKEQELPELSPGEPSAGHQSPTSTERALSNFGDGSMSLADKSHIVSVPSAKEHLFDVSDLEREPVLISKCGTLEVTFDFDNDSSRMNITIHRAVDIPSKDRGGANNTQVRILLLPTKKFKNKTKVKQGEQPEFMETFAFKVPSEEVGSMGVRFRLYGCERMRRERMIGEVIVGFASLTLEMSTTHNLTLEPRSNLSHGDSKMDVSSLSRSNSASSTQSMQHGGMPELLIGLTYNGTTGRLSVEAIKGSNFKNMAMNRAPDTYVKLTLMSPNGQEIARSKTSLRRGQPNPLYKETFMFQVALFQLPDVTLMVSVYNKRSMKRKEMIGWFALGYSSSGEEEVSHWNDMRESKGEPVCRWHVLLEA